MNERAGASERTTMSEPMRVEGTGMDERAVRIERTIH